MENTQPTLTPISTVESRKRDLSSPLSEQELKRQTLSPNGIDGDNMASIVPMQTGSKDGEGECLSPPGVGIANVTLTNDQLSHIAFVLKDSFKPILKDLVKDIVSSIVEDRLTTLEDDNKRLKHENNQLKKRVEDLEERSDSIEQYTRRNSVRILGISETQGAEDTDDIVLKMCTALSVPIKISDIDRSHRVGAKPRQTDVTSEGSEGSEGPEGPEGQSQKPKPRAIIVKFATYRARQKFYKARVNLKTNGYDKVFVYEDLTKRRSHLLFLARNLQKLEKLNGAWSSDGNILVKDTNDQVCRIGNAADLVDYE